MARTGNSYVVTMEKAHLEWGSYRHTDSRGVVYGEGYILIPASYAREYELYNSNYTDGQDTLGKNIFNFRTADGFLSGVLKSQGSRNAGNIYAKQFSVDDDLKALGDWYAHVNMQVGDKVEVRFTSPTDIVIRKI